MRYARIENSRVAEVIDFDPAGLYHPSLVWVECGLDVQTGWTCSGGVFAAPAAPAAPGPAELLARSDAGMARVLEDLVDSLVVKGVIAMADLPAAARDKITTRQAWRAGAVQ